MHTPSKTRTRTHTAKVKTVGRSASSAAKIALSKTAMAAKPAAAKKASGTTHRAASDLHHAVPGVVGRGRLTHQQVRRAVAVALRGKTFEADA